MPEGSAKSRPVGTWKCFSHMCNLLPNRKKIIHGFMVDTIIVFSWRNEFGRYLCDILNEFGMFSQYSRDNPSFANVDINVNQFQQTDFVNYSCYNKLYIIIPEVLKSLHRSPGYKKNQLVLCKKYVLQW
jgi:hypothetical protein